MRQQLPTNLLSRISSSVALKIFPTPDEEKTFMYIPDEEIVYAFRKNLKESGIRPAKEFRRAIKLKLWELRTRQSSYYEKCYEEYKTKVAH